MPNSIQEYLANVTPKAASDMVEALMRLPEDKRNWSPGGTARTALDQVAECAILNRTTAQVIENRAFPADFDFAAFGKAKEELAQDWDKLHALLQDNTSYFIKTILAVPEEDLSVEVAMPWGPMTLSQMISYPFWNMSYHEGQINYLASILGCLD